MSSVNIVAPTDQRSVRPSTSCHFAAACSGGMNAGVPIVAPLTVVVALRSLMRASPKSKTFTTPSLVRKMFSGLRIAVDDALGVGRGEHVEELDRERRHVARGQPAALLLGPIREGLAFEQLHDQEGRAVLGRVVVEHGDAARVLDLVGDVPLAEEARPRGRVGRDLRVEHLDGHPLPIVAVGGDVDRRHSPDAEQPLNGPLAAQDLADAGLGSLGGIAHRGLDSGEIR
ncbi:MAG: hypothetical protein QM820_28235 [Minicystis sp.]